MNEPILLPVPGAKSGKNLLVFFGIALGFGIVFNWFFVFQNIGISFVVFTILTIAVMVACAHWYKKPILTRAIFLLVLAFLFSSMVAVRANELLTFLNVVATVYALLVASEIIRRGTWSLVDWNNYRLLITRPFVFFTEGLFTAKQVATTNIQARHHKHLPYVVRGILIALPIVAILVGLLASADLVFAKQLSNLFHISWPIKGEYLFRLFVGIAITVLSLGALVYIFITSWAKKTPTETERRLGRIEAGIILGAVALLFATFILIQFAYLFNSEAAIAAQGFTYAQYARKGFFQLIFVAAFTLGLLFFVDHHARRDVSKRSRVLQIISSVLVIETLLIMVSAWHRLSLYQDAYGLTLQRFYAFTIVVWLAIVFVWLAYRIISNAREVYLPAVAIVTSLVFLMWLNAANPDRIIFEHNIRRALEGKKFDATYAVFGSGTDALPYVIAAARTPIFKNTPIQKDLLDQIKTRQWYIHFDHNNDTNNHWQAWNKSRKTFYRLLQENNDWFETIIKTP